MRFVQRERNVRQEIRFDIVAHSMGGLLLRYFLQFGDQLLPYDGSLPACNWRGAHYVDTAVTVGTPNGGSLMALEKLICGLKRNPVHPAYDPCVPGTMPALYQLLPRRRHRSVVSTRTGRPVDVLNVDAWTAMGWGLANPAKSGLLAALIPDAHSNRERRDVALDHLDKCLRSAKAFQAAMDAPQLLARRICACTW
jgi:pimeloyl-ACP methyl ester carboxylesterase